MSDADDLAFEVTTTSVSLSVDRHAHPLGALYGAAYVFLDRCYAFLDEEGDRVRITLACKSGEPGEAVLRGLGEELVTEVVSCTWRAGIAAQTRDVLRAASEQGHAAGTTPSLDDLEHYEFGGGGAAFDDPLGIAMSWEEKYAKKKPGDPAPPGDGKKEAP